MSKLILLFFVICMIQIASASHYMAGIVNDALDGEIANGKEVVLWNPANGIDNNLTDVIGPTGNSGADNIYMVDCELLSPSCQVGDEVRVKVLDGGDRYTSYWVNVSVTGAGYDLAPNITLNSIPNASLISPVDYENVSDEVEFNCSASDFDGLSNVTLYSSWEGWHANETKPVSGTYGEVIFKKNLTEGIYLWACFATDNLSISNFSSNFTITVDKTPPIISSVYVNESYICGDTEVMVNCTTNDALTNISSVIIESRGPTSSINYSAQLLEEGVYYSKILIDEIGEWAFNCISNDSVNNRANLTSSAIEEYSSNPDLLINFFEINFSNYDPIEKEPVVIEAVIHNIGCSDAESITGFYMGNPSEGNQIDENKTVLVPGLLNKTVNITWNAEIGTSNIFVFADINDSITESNESNNQGNNSINVGAWQVFFGNVSADKLLGDNLTYNMTLWGNTSNLQGNVFITDKESEIGWGFLQSLGIDKFGNPTADDFADADFLLGMDSYNDSVYNVFTNAGTPKSTENFLVHQNYVEGVPFVNSTNSSDFITGLLWDFSDDDIDGEFSQDDHEDLIFVTKINKSSEGMYGVYDYEIKIPVRLRSYDNSDETGVYLYYDLR